MYFVTSSEQMFNRTVTDLDTQPTTTHQRMTCTCKSARLLPDGCCCLSDKGNEILFKINLSPPLNKNRWTGRGGPMAWPPRSSDLTQMDFFLWGHIQTLIYTSPVDFEEGLLVPVVEAAANIRQQPGTFERTHQFLVRRRRLCIEAGGCSFEHLLYTSMK